jgi:hypothetical protein
LLQIELSGAEAGEAYKASTDKSEGDDYARELARMWIALAGVKIRE